MAWGGVGLKFSVRASDDTVVPTGLRTVPENEPNLPQPSKQPDPDPTDEGEVERVLAEAAGLTKDLEDEIGVEPPPAEPGVDLNPVTADPAKVDVDSELNKVEALLAEAQAAIDEEPAQQIVAETAGAAADAPEQEQSPTPQPDSPPVPASKGDEQMDPPPVAPPVAESDGPVAGEADIEPDNPDPGGSPIVQGDDLDGFDVAQPGDQDNAMGEFGGGGDLDPLEPSELTVTTAPAAVSAGRSVWSRFHLHKMLSFRDAVIPRGEEAILGLAERMLRLADVIDGLFAWVSYEKRRVVGWVALALLVAACSITAVTLS